MDHIDIWVQVGNVDFEKLSATQPTGEKTKDIRKRVERARKTQKDRFEAAERSLKTNSEMNVKDLSNLITLTPKIKSLLKESAEKLQLSARAYHRVIKLARTIADLGESENIKENHILEALQYRPRNN